jgi:hypothetical protein
MSRPPAQGRDLAGAAFNGGEQPIRPPIERGLVLAQISRAIVCARDSGPESAAVTETDLDDVRFDIAFLSRQRCE